MKPLPQLLPIAAPKTRSVLLGCVAGLLVACGSPKPEPAWPAQPSPSYPAPGDEPETSQDKAAPSTAPAEAPSSVSGSPLAEAYADKAPTNTLTGKATYYADSLAGNHTANGDIYDPAAFTAAHKTLPFGTVVRVIREDTAKATYVKVNDRGPFGSADRIIDLSKAAASELDMMKAGVISVRVEILDTPSQ